VGILDEVFEGVAKAKENVEGNLRNVSEVFEAYLQSVFTNCGKGWEENSLGNICEIYQPRTISTKEMKHDGQYVVYGANGVIGKYDNYNHEESQLFITCRGATCGSVNISTPKAWINGNAMVVRPKDESLNREFLTYFFRNGSEISKTITGAAQPQITRTTLAPLKIGFPKSLSEQKSIVTKLDALSTETKKLEAIYKTKLNHLEELKKSILKKAFNGEL
jgi:type I restriction enzyme S subunit